VVGRLRHCELRCVVELMGDCGDQNCDEGVSAGDLRREYAAGCAVKGCSARKVGRCKGSD
jgi:hypothetical protein